MEKYNLVCTVQKPGRKHQCFLGPDMGCRWISAKKRQQEADPGYFVPGTKRVSAGDGI